jgi:hypothetical protein
VRQRLRSHLTYANVMATLAVFLVLGGGAYAAFHLPRNSVRSKNIVNGSVGSADLRDNGVRGKDVLTGTIRSSDVGNGSLLSSDLKPGTLPSPDTPAQLLSKLTTVDGPGSGLDADTLGGVPYDQFLQGRGSEEDVAAGAVAGASIDTVQEIANVGKLTLTCATPAQPNVRYTNESGDNQRVFVDDGSGASVSQVLAAGNATADSQAGTSTNDARHTTFFVRLGGGFLLYDVWMTTASSGPSGSCHWFGIRRVVGFPF